MRKPHIKVSTWIANGENVVGWQLIWDNCYYHSRTIQGCWKMALEHNYWLREWVWRKR